MGGRLYPNRGASIVELAELSVGFRQRACMHWILIHDVDAAAHCAAAFIRKTAMSTVSERRCAATALAAVSLIRGYNCVMMKIGLAYASPLPFATLRFCLGALCLIPVVVKVAVSPTPARHQLRPVLLLGLMLAIYFGCTLTALRLRCVVF